MFNLRNFKFPKLKDEDCNQKNIKKRYMERHCEIAIKNLIKNDFNAYYCSTVADAQSLVLSLIPKDGVVGFGDSHTIFALGLDDKLDEMNCVAIPHTCAVNNFAFENKTPGYKIVGNKEETRQILMQYLVANVFLLSANAITMDGQIVNIDGTGNRIAGSIFGSDKIIVVAGANKISKDLDAAFDRIRFVSAQMNNIKYENDLACNKSGFCVDCSSENRYCNITSIIHKRPTDSDFHVVLIGEELGF